MFAVRRQSILKDAMHHLHPTQANSPENVNYAMGVLIGVISAIMATGHELSASIGFLAANVGRPLLVRECIPTQWISNFDAEEWELTPAK